MRKHLNEKIRFLFLSPIVTIGLLGSAIAMADGPAVPAGTTAAPAAAAATGPGGAGMFLPFVLMFGVIYFLMIRPQQKKMKEQQSMISQLKHGDEVITSSGLIGTVTGITEKVVTLELGENIRVKMLKSQVTQVLKGPIKDAAT